MYIINIRMANIFKASSNRATQMGHSSVNLDHEKV